MDTPLESGAPMAFGGEGGTRTNTSAGPASKYLDYPPWSLTAGHTERVAQLRTYAALAHVMRLDPALFAALRAGETDPIEFARAQDLVEALPSLVRRRLLATFTAITWPRSPRRAR